MAYSILHHLVKTSGRDTQVAHIGDIQHRVQQRLHVIACFRGGKHDGSKRNELQALGNDTAIGFGTFNLCFRVRVFTASFGTLLFLCHVPFVDNDNDAFSLLQDFTGNMGVLSRQALGCVDEQERDVAPFDSSFRAQHAEFLDAGANLAAPADTSRVDQYEFSIFIHKLCIDGVACRAGHFADNRAFGAQDRVKQGGFTHVGAPYDGNARDILVIFVFRLLILGRQGFYDNIEQVTSDDNRFSEAKAVKFDGIQAAGRVIRFVSCQDDGFLCAAQ